MTEKNGESSIYSINWPLVLFYIHVQGGGLYGLYLLLWKAKLLTLFFVVFLVTLAALAVTIGAHRLYAHRTYATTWHLRLFFVLAQTLAGVGSMYDWVIAHRVHHKYFKTEKDPYNHNKGFIYSHFISNVMSPDTEEYQKIVRDIDLRDIEEDGYVFLQKRVYWLLLLGLIYLNSIVPIVYWDEHPFYSFIIMGLTVTAIAMNISWLVNSAKHIWGMRPGDKYPVDDNSVFFVSKTYWLNYHYLLPWDWKTGEFGSYNTGFSTFILKMFDLMGLVDTMKTTSSDDIREALYQTATTDVTMQEVLKNLEELSEHEAEMSNLKYQH